MSRLVHSCQSATDVLLTNYGYRAIDVAPMTGFADCNYRIKAVQLSDAQQRIEEFTLKVSADGTEELLSKQIKLVESVREHGFVCPRVVPGVHGELVHRASFPVTDGSEKSKFFYMQTYLPGDVLAAEAPFRPQVLFELGELLANFHLLSKDRELVPDQRHVIASCCGQNQRWKMDNVDGLVQFTAGLQEDQLKLVKAVMHKVKEASYYTKDLEQGVIHGDFHEENIIRISPAPMGDVSPRLKYGILDWEDASYSCYLYDLAISLCHFMIASRVTDFIPVAGHVLAGYISTRPLTRVEESLLFPMVCSRYCRMLVLSLYLWKEQGGCRDYMLSRQKHGWPQLRELWEGHGEDGFYERLSETLALYNLPPVSVHKLSQNNVQQ